MREKFWHDKPVFVINPLKRKQAQKALKTVVLFLVVFSCFYVALNEVLLPGVKEAAEMARNDQIKPDMVRMANEGKTSAILWLASTYREPEYISKLDKLIEENNSDSMLLKAQLLWRTNNSEAMKLISSAAREGNSEAFNYMIFKN